jgi:hypothetical protein
MILNLTVQLSGPLAIIRSNMLLQSGLRAQ